MMLKGQFPGRAAVIATCLLMLLNTVPWTVMPGLGTPGAMDIVPLEDPPVWYDPLDDLSHVYIPDGGLINVEISGGDAHLTTGASEGWLASSIITCPAGYRYDLVLLEVDLPGASYVQLSVLNASKEASQVGYANETIVPFDKVQATDLSVYGISPGYYPKLRLQVNLVSSGADRPRLLAWSLHYVELDEWRDDFLGTGKMTKTYGINVTNGQVEINLTRSGKKPGSGEYQPYPPIFSPAQGGSDSSPVFYANAGRTGYDDATTFNYWGLGDQVFADLNGDGKLDMVCGNDGHGGSPIDSKIFWGTDTAERWTEAGATTLNRGRNHNIDLADVNGDGEPDIVMAVWYEDVGSAVYLNQGGGTFNFDPQITWSGIYYYYCAVGDLNNDGYDDIVFVENTADDYFLFNGGPSGPDTTSDATFTADDPAGRPIIADLDGDGFLDLALGAKANGKVPIFLGGPGGVDTTADIELSVDATVGCVGVGDINGDGYPDLVYGCNGKVRVFEGRLGGWDDASYNDIPTSGQISALRVVDIDLDGFDDIAYPDGTSLKICLGGETFPTSASITKSGMGSTDEITVAVPKSGYTPGFFGRFETEPISIPPEKKWDILHIDGAFPQNTSMSVTILSDTGKAIAGFKDLTSPDVDISGITLDRTIKIAVSIASEFNWTTPSLDLITVRWMDKGAWREQFYGGAKVERTQNVAVVGGELVKDIAIGTGPQILFTSILGDDGYTTLPTAFVDSGGLDYTGASPITFPAVGTSAADAADVNGDGYTDVAFAVHRTGDSTYGARSPLYLGTAFGYKADPDHEFPTTGASDVLVRDMNGDGYVDIVFAQETSDGANYIVNSTLFWGHSDGSWNATPDVLLGTKGATGVVAADLDGDGLLDLAFSCYKDATSTATDSLVFLQGATGFCGTVPSYKLPTKGARAVAAGDVDGDGLVDLAFANSFSTGTSEIDSYVYWGKAGGGYETTPAKLKTVGADDVKLADLDGDGDLDAVFANYKNNVPSYAVDSYIYLNQGSRTFPASPSARLPTVGATAVAVTDLDGTGRKDIVLACSSNGTSMRQSSAVYLGGATGWPATPSFTVPTEGATDVVVAHLMKQGVGGYVSRTITPEDPSKTGTFHTFRYTASLGASQSGTVQLLDASTWEVLAETELREGSNEWTTADLFWLKEHPSIRAAVTVSGLGLVGAFTLDDLWLNWTPRVMKAPMVQDLGVSSASLLRMKGGTLWINITDEYDPVRQLVVTLEHRLNGSVMPWATYLVGKPTCVDGTWQSALFPKANAAVGSYDFRVSVTDSDLLSSGYVVFPNAFTVLNNQPTAPVVRISPANAVTTSTLQAVVVTPATDVESGAVTYHYRWFRDGELQVALTSDTVLSPLTTRGENWSVEVRAYDGLDEGPAATAWVVIGNAGPMVRTALPNPELKEDTTDDKWINLTTAFEDPDGDHITWTVSEAPTNITVTIDGSTGKVTLVPKEDWYGEGSVTFVASDGWAQATQTILITVTPVDDYPVFTTVNGEPIGAQPIVYTIKQGGNLTIELGTYDVEGDALVFSVNTSAVEVDETTGVITFRPPADMVGTLRFAVTMAEQGNPAAKVKLNFAIAVENANDPPGDPSITSPKPGVKFKVEQNFTLVGLCTDPDTVYGQVLNFSWYANGTLLGYGASYTARFMSPGNYTIMLSVTDGEFVKTATMVVEIEAKEIPTPPPPPIHEVEPAAPPYALIVGAIVAVCVVLIVVFMLVSRRRADKLEAKDVEDEKREDFKRMAAEVRATADLMEAELGEKRKDKAKEVWVEETEVGMASVAAPAEEVPVFEGPSMGDRLLSIKPMETEAASKETEQLFKGAGVAAGAAVSAEEQERLRIDNLKRKYQTAIGRLPYGIPSAELKDRDWNELASALATGQKRTLPDGREVTAIGGRWYYSDPGDSSTFLKEHGAKPKEEPKKVAHPAAAATAAAPAVDKATLLAKLEERFIMGEISEQAYEKLRKKYESEDEKRG